LQLERQLPGNRCFHEAFAGGFRHPSRPVRSGHSPCFENQRLPERLMKKGLTWAFMGVNGITGEMEAESGHRQLLVRQTLHLLVVRVNNPFSAPHFGAIRERLAQTASHCYRSENRQTGSPAMIRHTVVFTLKHAAGSAGEKSFLTDAKILAKIPGVEKFEQLRQTSKKNDYSFGFSMEFADQAAYSAYNDHPDHTAFVQGRWIPEVVAFMEIDYVALD
jgi:Stress responsive A/B Barrel Domain